MSTLNHDDERLIRMLQGGAFGDNDDIRFGEDADSDAGSCCEESDACEADACLAQNLPQLPGNSKVDRIMADQDVRQTHGMGGKAMTGVKGVMNDADFHNEQERNREMLRLRAQREKVSKGALRSGWLERQLAADRAWNSKDEGDEDVDDLIRDLEQEEDAFVKEYKARRIMEMAMLAAKPSYGSLKEIGVDEFVGCVENPDSDVIVIMHLYQSDVEACRLVNSYLSALAPQHQHVKMVKIISTQADPTFDNIALPALLIYKGGELIKSLLRITDEIPGWTKSGRCDLDDFEEYLIRNQVLSRD
ncbi:hypothetical protein HDU98_001827 [Podochytrium sp. JEL0797]|nr:hypothetical protein HDU98_001827 [Podochytrium sp. JEL0797]